MPTDPYSIPISARAQTLAPLPAAVPGTVAVLSPAAGTAAGAALDRGETHYTDRPGIGALRALVAGRLSAAGIPVTAGEVVITCGIEEARFVALKVLGSEGVCGSTGGIAALAGLCGSALMGRAPLCWSTDDAPCITAEGTMVHELGHAAPPAGLSGRAALVVIGDLPGFETQRIGYLAASGLDPKQLRDFKQALTICSPNLSQWITLAILEAQDADA